MATTACHRISQIRTTYEYLYNIIGTRYKQLLVDVVENRFRLDNERHIRTNAREQKMNGVKVIIRL